MHPDNCRFLSPPLFPISKYEITEARGLTLALVLVSECCSLFQLILVFSPSPFPITVKSRARRRERLRQEYSRRAAAALLRR